MTIWVQHQDEELVMHSPEWELVPELVPADGEPRVFKEYNSSFDGTSLEQDLEALGVSRVALAGAAETVVNDLNDVLQWVTYADVSSSVAAVDELDFAAFA